VAKTGRNGGVLSKKFSCSFLFYCTALPLPFSHQVRKVTDIGAENEMALEHREKKNWRGIISGVARKTNGVSIRRLALVQRGMATAAWREQQGGGDISMSGAIERRA